MLSRNMVEPRKVDTTVVQTLTEGEKEENFTNFSTSKYKINCDEL